MGNILSQKKSVHGVASGSDVTRSSRKRKLEGDPDGDSLELLNTPKRKKIKSTSKYIYQTLFLNEEESDITIKTCGKDWKLHKVYLKQSSYFSGMFSGSWRESEMEEIVINITDENITQESLKIVFGSLYKDYIFIKPVQIVGVVAAATMFQLDEVVQQCVTMMTDTLSSCTVVTYLNVSDTYCLEEMRNKCMNWLTRNLLCTDHIDFIKDIDLDLMVKLLSSSKLFVIQMEIDIYTMIKRWIFLRNNQTWSGDSKDILKDANTYLKKIATEHSTCYVLTEEGGIFLPVFAAVRWHHVINDLTGIKMIQTDQVIPMSYLDPMIMYGWRRVLSVEQGHDDGPTGDIEESVFNENCLRCGRILPREGEYCWRWMGYNYGFDLLVVIVNRILSVRRNTHTETNPRSVSLQALRHLCYRVTISSVNENGKETYSKTTDIKKISLGKNEESIAMIIEKDLTYPIAISMNVMFLTPCDDDPIPKMYTPNT